MNYKTVTKLSDITLIDVDKIDLQVVDNRIKVLSITDSAGNVLLVRESNYGMSVEMSVPPPTVTHYVIIGTIYGVPMQVRTCTTSAERDAYINSLREKVGDNLTYEIVEKQVPVS